MNCEEYFGMYWSETLEEELYISFTLVDYDPSVGVDYEFEWEALDEAGKDRCDDLQENEWDEIDRLIYKHIKDNYGMTEI